MQHYTKTLLLVYSLTLLVASGCASSSARLNTKSVSTPQVTAPPSTLETIPPKWEVLPLPVEADILFVSGTELLLAGQEGVTRLRSDLTFQKLHAPKKIEEYFSKDGGITFRPSTNGASKSNIFPFSAGRICSTESASVNNGRFFATGPCEHTSQLRAYTLSGKDDVATVINFTYAKNSTDEKTKVYGPRTVFSAGGQDYLTTTGSNGPTILQIDPNPFRWKTVWKKQAPDTAILSLVQVDGQNYMLTSDGIIMRSENDLSSWTLFSKIPDELKGRVFDLKFRNSTDAYVSGEDGILLVSHDSGRTWSRQALNTNGSLYKIVFDTSRMAILVDFKTLLVSESGQEWKEMQIDAVRISDIQFFNHKLFVLTPEAVLVKPSGELPPNL